MDLSSEIYHALLPAFLTVTLGPPVAAMGALDGAAEATANMAKLVSGPLSDRNRRRKPWILLGYGMAALSKPLFPLAATALPVLGARFVDRIGKGIRGAPRDAMIADETPPELRGRAFGLRQSLDTVGAFLAPLAAVGLMFAFANDIRAVFWVAAIPAALSFLFAWVMLRESASPMPRSRPKWRGAGSATSIPAVKRLIARRLPVRPRALFRKLPDPQGDRRRALGALSPLVLALFNLAFMAARLPRRRAQRPRAPAPPAARRDRPAGRRRPVAGAGGEPVGWSASAWSCGARTWR